MWSKKVRKIVDISVLSVIGLTVLGVGGGKVLKNKSEYNDYSEQFDADKAAALEAQKDETGHIPVKLKAVAPTETSVGYTAGKKDKLTGEIYEGHLEIPMLTEEHYTRTTKSSDGGVTVIWTLKDEYYEPLKDYLPAGYNQSVPHTKGFLNVGGTNYLPPEFKKTFPGMELSFNEETSTLTVNVTKQGGVVLEKKVISVKAVGTTLKFTGEPLTLVTDGGKDALNIESKTCDLVVENELDVHIIDRINSTGSTSAIVARKITVNEGGCLRTSNFCNGIYTREDIEVKGELDVAGVSKAIYYSSSTNGGKNIVVAPGRSLYIKETKKALTDGTTYLQQNCDKHVAVCLEGTDIESFISFKLVEITKTPTESEGGSAKFACVGCGTKQKTITLPMLNNTDYEVIETPTEIDGEIVNINCYTYHFTEIKADDLVFDLRENLNSYFTVGDSYCTLNGWNTKYPNATASVKDNVFTATLTGDITFDLGDAGGIDFSIFDKVVLAGAGTFKVITNQKSALITNKLEVGEDVILDLNGTNCSKTTYIVEDRDGNFDGIVARQSLVLNGKVSITNFYVGILTNGTCSISASADISITKTIYGVYSNAATTLTSNGKLTFTNTASATKYTTAIGLYSYRSAVTYHFTGNSETTITTGNQGLGTVDSNAANNVTLRASGSAKVTLRATNTGTTNYAVSNINHFIVANDNDAECNATVSLIANSSAAMNYLAASSADHSFVVNTTGDVVLWKDGSKVSQNGVNFNAGKYDFKILSNVKIQRFDYAMNFSSVTVKSAVCDHKVITNVPNFACNNNFKGTLPAGITEAGWIYTE